MNHHSKTLETLYKAYHAKLLGFIRSKVSHKEDAQDILSEVFLKMHQGIAKLDHQEHLVSWMYTITRHAIIDFYRKTDRTRENIALMEASLVSDELDEAQVRNALGACLEPMIQSLPPKYARILFLSELEGLKHQEIADRYGLNLSTTKSIVSRAKTKLKEKLIACCHYEYDTQGNIIDFHPQNATCKGC